MHPAVFADLLAELEATVPRLPGAACVGHHELFDLLPAGTRNPDYWEQTAAALQLCRGCPALQACKQWLVSLASAARPSGVVAGMTATEIREIPKGGYPPRRLQTRRRVYRWAPNASAARLSASAAASRSTQRV